MEHLSCPCVPRPLVLRSRLMSQSVPGGSLQTEQNRLDHIFFCRTRANRLRRPTFARVCKKHPAPRAGWGVYSVNVREAYAGLFDLVASARFHGLGCLLRLGLFAAGAFFRRDDGCSHERWAVCGIASDGCGRCGDAFRPLPSHGSYLRGSAGRPSAWSHGVSASRVGV